jgi:hypothetical protein
MRSQVETLFIERSLTKYLFLRAFGYQSIANENPRTPIPICKTETTNRRTEERALPDTVSRLKLELHR